MHLRFDWNICDMANLLLLLYPHLGTGSGLGNLFLVMLGLMAFKARTGASAFAAVPICVASDAYCNRATDTVRHNASCRWLLVNSALQRNSRSEKGMRAGLNHVTLSH